MPTRVAVFLCGLALWCGPAHAQNAVVSWVHDGINTDGYHVHCDDHTNPTTYQGSVPVGTTSFELHGQTVGQRIYCRAYAYNDKGVGGAIYVPSVVIQKNNVNVKVLLEVNGQGE